MAERLVVERHKSAQERALAEPELPILSNEYVFSLPIVPPVGSVVDYDSLNLGCKSILPGIATDTDKLLPVNLAQRQLQKLELSSLRNHARKSTNGGISKRVQVSSCFDTKFEDKISLHEKEKPNQTTLFDETLFPVVLEKVPSEYYSSEFSFPSWYENQPQSMIDANNSVLSICLLCLEKKQVATNIPCGDAFCTRCLSHLRMQAMQICPICFVSLRDYFCKKTPTSKPIITSQIKVNRKRIAIRSKSKWDIPSKIAAKLNASSISATFS